MKDTLFAIIDVETTGSVSNGKMTEVCIVLVKNGEMIDKYTSLINPETYIPAKITALTGIDNQMVEDAPKFYEIAKEVEEFTRDAIFVAHNVNFDFGFFRKEFYQLGFNYTRKKLCTVRLSRKLIPGLPSYSLGRLTRSVGIPLVGAHRAEADTVATAHLFLKLLKIDAENDYNIITTSLHAKSKEGTLPPHLPAKQIFALPETAGIYLFKNEAEKVIYAGKAKNIKKRVLSHLYSKAAKEVALANETFHIDFEETGNELTALLLESDKIRHHYPKYNRAQKKPVNAYQIICYENRKGIIQLALGKTKVTQDSLLTLYNRSLAVEKLEHICEVYQLCPRFCTLQSNVEKCSHYKLVNCKGICENNEEVADYNLRVKEAMQFLESEKPTYIIQGAGRNSQEQSIILVEKGIYKGFGFIDTNIAILHFQDFYDHITMYLNTYHTSQLIQSYIRKHGERGIIKYDDSLALTI